MPQCSSRAVVAELAILGLELAVASFHVGPVRAAVLLSLDVHAVTCCLVARRENVVR